MFGHVWAAGFQRKGKVTMKGRALGRENTKCRQADDDMRKFDPYQAANRKRKFPKT